MVFLSRAFILCCTFFVLSCNVTSSFADSENISKNSPPNIVFIIADDLRYDLLGCNGHPDAITPNIDRLAQEGVNFNNFFATTPLCSPSRATFLTGLYPHTNRIVNNDSQGLDIKSHRLMTFPRILREKANYKTALIGKWHMGFDDSRRPGFDHWISFKGQGQFIDPVVNMNGQQIQTKGYLTDLITDWGVEFLKQEFDQPFCLFLSHEAVHQPFIPASRHESLYKDVKVTIPPVDHEALKGKKALTRKLSNSPNPYWFDTRDSSPEPGESRRGRPDDMQSVVRDQLRCITAVDEGVGRIVNILKQKGILNNTIVIFTSDQGYLQGEFGLRKDKRWPYDPCLRIPFMMRYPKLIKKNSTNNALMLNTDVAPTLLDLAQVKWHAKFHGESFVPLLKKPQSRWRKSMFFEYFEERVTPRCPRYFAVRTRNWKYIHYPQLDGMDELYDIKSDPGERFNLINRRQTATKLAQLRGELKRLHDETQNPFPLFQQ
jgi:N-acetylglucosamine-6-sulfatase